MKTVFALLAFASLVLGGCGTSADPSTGQSSEDLKNPGPTAPVAATPPPSVQPPPRCASTEHRCAVESTTGACATKCVPLDVACGPTACVVCDPNGPPPHAACQWNGTTCKWDCPVCDPSGPPPHAGCQWNLTSCAWDCPVCDPSGPPPHAGCQWNLTTCKWDCPVCDPSSAPPRPGCTWDTKSCVWVCL